MTLAPVGGAVVDLIGVSGNRVVGQLEAGALLGNQLYPVSPMTFGTQAGYTPGIVGGLGGQITEMAVRLTLRDGDNAAGEFDFNRNTLVLNGVTVGNFSDVNAESTNNAGTPTGAGFSGGGFRDGRTDTGWFYITDPAVLAAVLVSLEGTGQIVFALADVDTNDNGFDFSLGVDALGAGLPVGVFLFQTLENIGRTPTQKQVGRALDTQAAAGNDLQTVHDLILGLPTADQQRAALDAVAGRQLYMAGDTVIGAAEVQGLNIDSRLNALRRGQRATGVQLALADDPLGVRDVSGILAALPGAPLPDQGAPIVSDAQDPLAGAAPSVAGRPGPLPTDDRFGVFVLGSLTLGEVDTSDAQQGAAVTTAGVTVGVDTPLDERTILGGALGFTSTDSDFDDGSSFDAQGLVASLYGTHRLGESWYLDLAGSYGIWGMDTARRIVFPGLDRTARGDTQGQALSAMGRVSYQWGVRDWLVTPEFRGRYAYGWVDGYTETGAGGLNLIVSDQEIQSLTTTLGVTVSRTWLFAKNKAVTPYVGVAWEGEWLDDGRTIPTAFAGAPGGAGFDSLTDGGDGSYGRVTLGGTAKLGPHASLYADYHTLFGHRDTRAHTFFAGVRVGF